MAIPDSFFEELKYKTDIEDVVSNYVSLKGHGRTLVGLCPFHNEKTPSFNVYKDTQSFYCFGCGAGGDLITFVKRIENLDYIDAVKLLADRAGLQIPQDGKYDKSIGIKRRKILTINRVAAKFYHMYMLSNEGKAGLDYYLSRGLEKSTINHFGLGYAPDSWDSLVKHLKQKGFYDQDIIDAGLAKRTARGGIIDIFRNRVMTPIIDIRGNVIAFGGRVLDDSKPKYINTSDTLVYKKTKELFSMNFAKDSKEKSLILCEGYMDVIAMHQAGFENAVAGCGTALTSEQVRLISRYTKEVILTYDADEAGQKALSKAIAMFADTNVKVKVPKLVGGKDPDEIIRTYGRDKFKGILDGCASELEYKIMNVREQHNLNSTQGKLDFLRECIKILAARSPLEQDLYFSRLAEETGVEKQNIKAQLDDYKRRNVYRQKKREYQAIVNNSMRENAKLAYTSGKNVRQIKAENRIIDLLFLYPDCAKLIKDFDISKMSDGFVQKIVGLLIQRIIDNESIELAVFGSVLTDDEMGRLSGIIASGSESKDSKAEILQCIAAVDDEYKKSNVSISPEKMSDDEFRNLFRQKDDNT